MIQNKKHFTSTYTFLRCFTYLLISQSFLLSFQSFAQEIYTSNELEINRTFDFEEEKTTDFNTNPFEIVDRIRRFNSMNDATKPSDAIDDAIKSFDMINEDK